MVWTKEIRGIYYITNIEIYSNLNLKTLLYKTLINNNIYILNINESFQKVDVIRFIKFQT